MAEVFRMPKMSDTMEEGQIVEWHKKVGDKVEEGEIIADVETDKATMELESYFTGTLLHIGIKAGETVPVDSIIAIIGEEGEDYKKLLDEEKGGKEEKADKKEDKKEKKKEEKPEEEPAEKSSQKEEKIEAVAEPADDEDDERVKASPLARKMAEEKGIEISRVKGTGDNGRIVKRDIEEYKETAAPAFAAVGGEEGYEDHSISQMRKTIAKRLAQSKFTAPHFYLTMEIIMDKAMEARKSINDKIEGKVSFNDFIIKAAAIALRKHPQVNSSWLDDKIRTYKHVHMGVAVAVDEGLMVPVVKHADQKGLQHISAEVKDFAAKARDKKLQPEDYQGNTFTISNLGMFDIDEFTAIINPPDACILAVGGIKEKVVVVDGEIAVTNVMKVTLSCDHRVVDGVTGARFLQTFKSYLEEPYTLLA